MSLRPENGMMMNLDLPLRYRVVIAIVLFAVGLVAGTWGSTLVGDENPTLWGLVLGTGVGAAVATGVLVGGRRPGPPTGPMLL
jgi:uncharacterized protein YqgC (DUF456 family)